MTPKKSETLEIRLSHAAKTAFMERCRAAGVTASEALRAHIEGQAPRRSRRLTVGIAALIGLMIGAVAAPSLAAVGKASSDRAAFVRMDANHDGVVSFAEFRGR